MSHELMQDDRMVYAGEVPWHGLGTEIPAGTKVREGFAIAKLDWEVETRKLYAYDNEDVVTPRLVPGNFAIARKTDNKILGVVGSQFTPVQNIEAFEALDKVLGPGTAELATAGSLKGGRLIWAMLQLPGDIQVRGRDFVRKYVTVINGHDGHTLYTTFATPVRIVCWNTMQMAIARAELKASTKHTRNVGVRINNIAEKLGHALTTMKDYEGKVKFLAATPVKSSKEVEQFLVRLNFEQQMEKVTSDRLERYLDSEQATEVKRLFEAGKGNDMAEIKHTYWALLNGVTEYVDHFKTPGGKKKHGLEKRDARLTSAWMGTGAALKNRALDLAVAMASKQD